MIWIVTFLGGCSTATRLESLEYSFSDVQRAVGESMPNGIAKRSSNQRTFWSNYFLPIKRTKKIKRISPYRRAQAMAVILGDRKPYDVEVTVFIDKRQDKRVLKLKSIYHQPDLNEGIWNKEGESIKTAKILTEKIHGRLVKRRKNHNIIDDFRPF